MCVAGQGSGPVASWRDVPERWPRRRLLRAQQLGRFALERHAAALEAVQWWRQFSDRGVPVGAVEHHAIGRVADRHAIVGEPRQFAPGAG